MQLSASLDRSSVPPEHRPRYREYHIFANVQSNVEIVSRIPLLIRSVRYRKLRTNIFQQFKLLFFSFLRDHGPNKCQVGLKKARTKRRTVLLSDFHQGYRFPDFPVNSFERESEIRYFLRSILKRSLKI